MKLKKDFEKHAKLYSAGFLFDANTRQIFADTEKLLLIPEGYETWEAEKTDLKAYCKNRLKELGIKEKDNLITLIGGVNMGANEKCQQPVFLSNAFGDIEIAQYSLERRPYTFTTKGETHTSKSNREKYHVQTRLHPLHENMCEAKYDFTNAKNVPFWHKSLIELYEQNTPTPTLFITEGQIKAFKASFDGIPTVGLTSISHYRSKETGTIHPEIISFIKACAVQRLVILWDGDCRNISSSALKEGEDLAKRPNNFYKFAAKIREMIQDFFPPNKLEIFFATIKTEELRNAPKGIDDLLIEYQAEKNKVVKDVELIGDQPCSFFEWTNITNDTGVKKMRKFFNLESVKSFYQFHDSKIKDSEFVYFGTTYRIEKGEPLKKIDANVKNYKRIGTDYYKLTREHIPTGRKDEASYEIVLSPWTKQAIVDDHGKDVIDHIERYEGFTNDANHVDYQQVVGTQWNLYYNVDHASMPGDFPHIQKLLQHLFADQYSMILDYISVLYRRPMQKLPVICLVSREQRTGKSTFIYLLKLIFKQNMAVISNNDLTGDFNSHWTSKLVVGVEETAFDKKEAYEKIKSLTTAKTISRNEKNRPQREIPCMLHFVFCSNHEDDFIKIDDYDSRLWIRKIGSIAENIKNFDDKISDEIPYFIDFIQNREIEYEDQGERLFFNANDFRTDAFRNVVKHSEPALIKELREHLIDSFIQTGVAIQEMDAALIREKFLGRYELNYIQKEIFRSLGLITKNSTLSFYYVDQHDEQKSVKAFRKKARFYTFKREDFIKEGDFVQPEEQPQPEEQQEKLPF